MYLPKPIEKVGKEVEFMDLQGSVDGIVSSIVKDYQNLSKSVGVVIYNHPLKDEIISNLKEKIADQEKLILLEEVKKGFYTPRGIYVMDFDNCKGLEFNKVYLVGFEMDKVGSFDEAKKAFVGVTRAMNELIIAN